MGSGRRWDLAEDGIWLGRWVGLLRAQDKKGDTCSNCLTLTLLIREKHPQETETTHISLGRGRGDGKKIKLMAQNCQFCNLSKVSFPLQRQEIVEQNPPFWAGAELLTLLRKKPVTIAVEKYFSKLQKSFNENATSLS